MILILSLASLIVYMYARQGCSTVIRCCNKESGERANTIGKNYYELLGVAVDSDSKKIKQAYRNLQKRYHPDVVGQEVITIVTNPVNTVVNLL